MKAYGVDGCKAGWFYIEISDSKATHGIVSRLWELVDQAPYCSHVFVDIPIGLRDRDGTGRVCDVEARRLLGSPRRSSIFNAPIRAIMSRTDYPVANAESKKISGKGLSKQTFAITPKIAEVDSLMRSNQRARKIVREVHPELCFYGLAGQRPMTHRKKRKAGFEERLAVLVRHFPDAVSIAEGALSTYPRKLVAADDVLDAFVCALTATMPDYWQTVPDSPDVDSHGLPMEMVYCDFSGSKS